MSDQTLDTCNCCEGVEPLTPASLENQPGLSALVYRVGTHGQFKATMQAALAGQVALHDLTTREDDDHSIALIDAWATVLDVLSFYQERIANEGYLRTATERRSVLELARAIGYELNPGVAASTYLAFTLESGPGSPEQVAINVGTKTQSLPGPGELPQTFETVEPLEAHIAWNALRPRLTQPQQLIISGTTLYLGSASTSAKQLYLSGTTTGVKAGDLILITTLNPTTKAVTATLTRFVQRVVIESDLKRTRIDFDLSNQPSIPPFTPPSLTPGAVGDTIIPFSAANVQTYIVNQTWRESELAAFLTKNQWPAQDVLDVVNKSSAPDLNQAVYVFRERAGCFGNNAPYFNSIVKADGTTLFPGAQNWDTASGWEIWKDWPNNAYYSDADLYLERSLPGVLANTWTALARPSTQPSVYRITAVTERSLTGFALSSKCTGLTLGKVAGGGLADNATDKANAFRVRATTAYVQSEQLDLIDLSIVEAVPSGATSLLLDQLVLGLQIGQAIILTGEDANSAGVTRHEVVFLKDIRHGGGFTTLEFQAGLQYGYVRQSLTINANVVLATHGETKTQVLGSGDASQPLPSFLLKEGPLTYVASASPSGADSTLKVNVNDIQWKETPSLFGLGPRDRAYAVRLDDDGKTTVQFGDGTAGARPPTGIENIVAHYRVGIGLAGLVKAGQLSLLLTRPLGVKSVINPLAADGAADPEKLDEARTNAPFTVLTLERVVSLPDFADFARAFAGIGKSQATWLWDGEKRLVHLTIAAANGGTVSESSNLFVNLRNAIDAARDPIQQLVIQSYRPLTFNVEAKVLVVAGYDKEKVKAAALAALQQTFAFASRRFGQGVTPSEVLTAIQAVAGVQAVDLDKLYLAGQTAELKEALAANIAHWDTSVTPAVIKAAELLTINSTGIQLTDMPVV